MHSGQHACGADSSANARMRRGLHRKRLRSENAVRSMPQSAIKRIECLRTYVQSSGQRGSGLAPLTHPCHALRVKIATHLCRKLCSLYRGLPQLPACRLGQRGGGDAPALRRHVGQPGGCAPAHRPRNRCCCPLHLLQVAPHAPPVLPSGLTDSASHSVAPRLLIAPDSRRCEERHRCAASSCVDA